MPWAGGEGLGGTQTAARWSTAQPQHGAEARGVTCIELGAVDSSHHRVQLPACRQGGVVSWGGAHRAAPPVLVTPPQLPAPGWLQGSGHPMGLCPPVQMGAATLVSGQAPRGICCRSSAAAVQRWRRALGCSAPRAVPVPARSRRAPVLTVGVGVRSLLVRHDPGRGVVHLRREGTRELSACGQGAGEAAVLARPLCARCCCSDRWRQGRGERGQQGEGTAGGGSPTAAPRVVPP